MDKIHGKGTFKWATGNQYNGQWNNNQIDGIGTFKWGDGLRKYDGNYVDGLQHGYGVYTCEDQGQYQGMWVNGQQHGKGKYVFPNGKVEIGIWDNGKIVAWIPK